MSHRKDKNNLHRENKYLLLFGSIFFLGAPLGGYLLSPLPCRLNPPEIKPGEWHIFPVCMSHDFQAFWIFTAIFLTIGLVLMLFGLRFLQKNN